MDRAWANGLHWFDTGDAYGGGTSETWIGRWRADRAATDLAITTKVFHSTTGDPDDTGLAPDRIRRQLESSLGRLGVERVDLYLAHEPDPRTPVADTIASFEQLAGEGLVGAWGLSNYAADGIEEALRHGRPSLIQNTYSLLDRADEERVLPLCAEHGFAYVPFGPLSGGWLTGKYRRDQAYPEGSRMTQRPGPYERLADRRRLRRPRAARRFGPVTRCRHGDARLRLGAVRPRGERSRLWPEPRLAPRSRAWRARSSPHSRRTRRNRRLLQMTQVRILDHEAVSRLLPMRECIDVMADALASLARGEVHNPLRFVVRPPDEPSLLGLMPAHRAGSEKLWGLKTVAIFPGNSARGLDSHQGFVALFDGETGEPRTVMNAGAITSIRTAAVSGVATRLLARDDAKVLAILGAGIQGSSHLEAMRAVHDFERVVVWSRTPGRIAGVDEAPSCRGRAFVMRMWSSLRLRPPSRSSTATG